MGDRSAARTAPPVSQATDLPLLLSTVQAVVQRVGQLTPQLPESLHQELEIVLSETLSDANSLFNIVAVQQQLTGVDPLGSAAIADLSPASEDEDDGFDDSSHAQPDEPLSDDAKQLLMTVFAAYDSLNSKQVSGLALAAKCSNQQVRSFFSDMRTRLRNLTTAAIKRAGKAVDLQQQQQQQGPEHGQAGPGAGKYGQPRKPHGLPYPLNPNQQQLLQQQQHQQQQQHSVFSVPLPSEANPREYPQQQQQQQLISQVSLGPLPGPPAATPGLGPTCAAVSANISGQREKLSKMVDQQNGAITSGGKFLGTLSSITTWAGRTAALAALTASYSSAHNSNTNTNSNSRGNTGPGGSLSRQLSAGGGSGCCASAAVRGQLGSSRLLDVLEGWTKEAAADKQITVMIQLMQSLSHINLSTALLQGSSISQTVQELTSHDNTHVAAAATQLLKTWTATTGYTAASDSKQQQQRSGAVYDGLIALGGNRQLSTGYKRRVNIAVKRTVEQMQLVGDLKRGPSGTVITAPAAVGPAAAAVSGISGQVATAAVSSSQLKQPSKRPRSAVATGSAANGVSEAARRLAALHSPNRVSQQQQHQQSHPVSQGPKTITQLLSTLPPYQRLWHLAPAGRAAAAFLAAAGPWAAEVTQATQDYDKAVHRWLTHRVGAVRREQETAAAALQAIQQQQQQQQQGDSSSNDAWVLPPALPAAALAELAAGQESKVANDSSSLSWLQQPRNGQQIQQQQQHQSAPEPDEAVALSSAAAAAAAAAGGGVRRVPWRPTDANEDLAQRCWMWAAGIRLPMHVVKPPTTAEFNRFKQKHEEEQQRMQQQQPGLGQYYAAAGHVQQGHHHQQQQFMQQQQQFELQPMQQQTYPHQLPTPIVSYPGYTEQQQQQSGPVYMMTQQQPPQQQHHPPVIIVVPASQTGAAAAAAAAPHQGVAQVLMQQAGLPQQQQGYFPQGY